MSKNLKCRQGRGPLQTRMTLESLEERVVPAVFKVNTLLDPSLSAGVNTATGAIKGTNGVVSLRSAIQAANATPGGNTIELTVGGTYKLTLRGAGEDNNATGDLDILPSGGNLTIKNTSGKTATVNGNRLDRVFDINPNFNPANPTPRFTVTLVGFTITGGAASPGDGAAGSGGGIRDQGNASLTLTDMVITGNTATADGGGVSMENTVSTPWTLTVNNSTISNNRAGDAGGGLETDGSGKVFVNTGSVITNNTAVNQGAGIWLDAIQVNNDFQGASLNVTGTLISGNKALSAGGVGGGIGNAGNGAVTISNSTLENNIAGATGGGFGDENAQGNLTVLNSTVLNNTATGNGGGIAAGGPITSITNSEIDGNDSGGDGGGVFANGTTLFVQNSTLANNLASNGGGIELQTTGTGLFNGSTITNTTLSGNTALNNAGGNGGGLDLPIAFTGDLLLQNDSINGNNAVTGGGIFSVGGGNVGMRNTIVANNSAPTAPDLSVNQLFLATLFGFRQVPPVASPGMGTANLVFNPDQNTITVNLSSTGLIGFITAQHLHNGASGTNGPVAVDAAGQPIELGTANPATGTFTVNNTPTPLPFGAGTFIQQFVSELEAGNIYTNIHTTDFPTGEVRGQFVPTGKTFTDLGGNLIGVAGPGSGNNFTLASTTQSGTVDNPLDPLKGPLQNNGGPTIGAPGHTMTLQTEALLKGSPAIGTGILAQAPATDERGFPSVVNGTINVGAVSQFQEKQPSKPPKPNHHHHHPYQQWLNGLSERIGKTT